LDLAIAESKMRLSFAIGEIPLLGAFDDHSHADMADDMGYGRACVGIGISGGAMTAI
jgi:hypothetical protein